MNDEAVIDCRGQWLRNRGRELKYGHGPPRRSGEITIVAMMFNVTQHATPRLIEIRFHTFAIVDKLGSDPFPFDWVIVVIREFPSCCNGFWYFSIVLACTMILLLQYLFGKTM
jgi:hypothetical protein